MSHLRITRSKRHSRPCQLLWLALLVIPAVDSTTCDRHSNAQAAFEHARQTFIHGDLARSQEEAEEGYRRFSRVSPGSAWKFRILEAESLLWRGMSQKALATLRSMPSPPEERDSSIE